jgi:formyl-CoA transferase
MPDRRGPLSRFTVLDLTRVRAGPTTVRQLADWGANVIKIEAPEAVDPSKGLGGSRDGPDFQNLHRNKRGMTLNLKAPEGKAVLMRLVERADVVVENYRPDVKHRLGIDYEALSAVNPGIVYTSISGFGQDGPYAKRPGFDQIAQGMGGLMSITGEPGRGPMRVGIPVADLSAGLYAAIGTLVALLEREETGRGRWVHTSLLEAQISMLDFQAARWTIAGEVAPQAGNNHPTSIPTGVFRTSDGHINVACSGQTIWERFARAIGAEVLIGRPEYADEKTRLAHRDELNSELDGFMEKRPGAGWIDVLNEAGVPCGEIYGIDQVFADPQVRHLGMCRTVEHPRLGRYDVVGQAARLEGVDDSRYTASPDRGQHTREVLAELGYAEAEIDDLAANGIV